MKIIINDLELLSIRQCLIASDILWTYSRQFYERRVTDKKNSEHLQDAKAIQDMTVPDADDDRIKKNGSDVNCGGKEDGLFKVLVCQGPEKA